MQFESFIRVGVALQALMLQPTSYHLQAFAIHNSSDTDSSLSNIIKAKGQIALYWIGRDYQRLIKP